MDQLTWPSLSEPYQTAFVEAVNEVFARFSPAGIIATGTIVRGNPDPASDLDIYVVHRQPVRQRIQQFFNGVPTEIFVNPPEQVERYIDAERSQGRPFTAHMFSTGFTIYDPEGIVKHIQKRATEVLARGPEPTAAFLLRQRYATATWFEDALDMVDIDQEMCRILLFKAVEEATRYRFWDARQWQPRHKSLFQALEALDSVFAQQVRQFHRARDIQDHIRLARKIVHRSVGATGFFEWESDIEPIA